MGAIDRRVIVEVEGLKKTFGSQEVLRGIDLQLFAGEIISIIGASGGGKSTFIRCLNLLERPTSGRITIAGRDIFVDRPLIKGAELIGLRRKVGMVFQQFNLFAHLTAIENVVLPLIRGPNRLPQRTAIDAGLSALREVGLKEKALAFPRTLSGGEQQRVAIARALALRPEIMLFDEPTSSLDPESTSEVLDVMCQLANSGMTMVVVTHELGFAGGVSDEMVFLADGLVCEQGPPTRLLHSPLQGRTRDFVGRFQASAAGESRTTKKEPEGWTGSDISSGEPLSNGYRANLVGPTEPGVVAEQVGEVGTRFWLSRRSKE